MNNNFTRLTSLTEQLQNELLGVLSTADDIQKRQELLEQGEQDLGRRQRDVSLAQKAITAQKDENTRNREYVDRENIRVSKLSHQLEYDKGQLADITDKLLELEAKKEEIHKHEVALGERIKKMEALLEKETELQEREAKVTKDITIDRERKRLLDLREERIKRREAQLQLDSEKTDL